MVNRLSPAFAALLLTLSASALAEPLNYNQVQLSADARREVNNDTLNAVLFSEESHSSPARLAALLNDPRRGRTKASFDPLARNPVNDWYFLAGEGSGSQVP